VSSLRPLAEVTAVTPVDDDTYRVDIGEEALIPGGLVNGGILLVVAARALAAATGRPHPVTITGHYLTAVRPGPVTIRTEVLRPGRHAYARALVRTEDGMPALAATGTFTDLAEASGPTLGLLEHPPMPDPDHTIPWPPEDAPAEGEPAPNVDVADRPAPNVFNLFRHRVVPDGFEWATGAPGGDAVVEAWAEPAAGSWDPLDLLVLADVYPPPVFNTGKVDVGWVPTLELTVQLRGLPRGADPVACRFWTSSVTDGYLEEDGLIRDADGRLLVVSRQLALAPRPRGPR
jgi:acyl-coenzyme A thioesterase PaaI-like protein